MQDSDVDDLDRQVINALQVNPRASWSQLGAVLAVDPATVARRWRRMHDAGVAWVVGYPAAPLSASALVEVECGSNSLALAETLAHDAECLSVDITAGGRDLLLTVRSADERGLTDYLLSRLGTMPAIQAVRTNIVTQVITEASQWRLRELTDFQVSRLGGAHDQVPLDAGASRPRSTLDRAVLAVLCDDGRMSAPAVAARLEAPVRQVRDAVARLVGSGQVVLRTEMARSLSGWPIYAWYFMRVPAAKLPRAAPLLGQLKENRLLAVVAGRANLIMGVWMRTVSDVTKFEAAVEQRGIGVEIVDRSIVLRTTKRVGVRLDVDGKKIFNLDKSSNLD